MWNALLGSAVSRRSFLVSSSMFMGAQAMNALDVRTLAVADTAAPRGKRRDLLQKQCPPAALAAALLPLTTYAPWPKAGDAAWKGLAAERRAALLAEGEGKLGFEYKAISATLFLEYARMGNRSHYEARRTGNLQALWALTLAECVENKGRFLDDIANGLWAICEQSFWGVPAHLYIQKADLGLPDPREPIVDLFVGDTSAEVARVVYLLGAKLDRVSPLLRDRVYAECERRVLNPLIEHNFMWMGLPGGKRRDDLPWDATPAGQVQPVNNWDAWICWNWLTTALLVDRDAKRRTAGVQKAMVCLDRFIDTYPDDGGCEEGCSYWSRATGSMADALELLDSATKGRVNIWREPLLRKMGEYMVVARIAGDQFLDTGDAHLHALSEIDKVYQYGKRTGSPELMALARTSLKEKYAPQTLPALFDEAAFRAAKTGPAPLRRDVWLPETALMAARMKADSAEGLYVACIAADNGKSHSHNDTGSFWVYLDGEPVIIDLGAESYRKQSFDVHRYEIESMQSGFHNLPTIAGVQQGVGSAFRATALKYAATGATSALTMDLAEAYPKEAKLKTWMRTVTLDRSANVASVGDRYLLGGAGEVVWSLMTCRPVTAGGGTLRFAPRAGDKSSPVEMTFDSQQLSAKVETIHLTDPGLTESWGNVVYRVLLTTRAKSVGGSMQFLFRAV